MKKQVFAIVLCILLLSPLLWAQEDKPELTMYLFATSTCAECKKLKEEIFPEMLPAYGTLVNYIHIAIDDKERFKLQLLYEEEFKVKSDESVKLFVGTRALCGLETIKKELVSVIDSMLEQGADTIKPEAIRAKYPDEVADQLLEGRFEKLRPMIVAGAGLIDGINPCAFVTLVFFVTVLANLKKSRREILLVGLAFSSAVFLTYLGIGIAALKAIKVASVELGIAAYLTYAVAAFTLVLAIISLKDYIKIRRGGKATEMSLKLPAKVRYWINRMINTKMRSHHIITGAIVAGVGVSILESMCTGQVYLPIITSMIEDGRQIADAMAYLVLYNIMFILPLLVVFMLSFYGVSSQQITAFFTKNVALSKLLLSILFFALAILLIAGPYLKRMI